MPPGIEQLHRRDITATLSGDPRRLAQLWTEDAVRLEPGADVDVGKAAIHAADEKDKTKHPDARFVSYRPEFQSVKVLGNTAIEWGFFAADYKESSGAKVQVLHAKFLRVLRRLRDGSWRFSMVMWNRAE